ncbi:transmembrane domain-containing protein [Cryptosporangium sp. NPDC051539]|uniref:transmembrane domain-containing protein n=1 Tax=Cryptosporangium sp. NPDC051539 TaxID=3363962 RepID=UPI00379CF41F
MNDNRLPEISGLVAVDDGYAVITDSDDSVQQVEIYLLDAKCQVTKKLTSAVDPFDPEDLARTSDGSYWVADIGDSDSAPERATIAVHLFPPSGTPTIQRMRYPDGAKNAEALIVQNNNIPVIVTKSASGVAKVYKASKAISGPSKSADQAVPLTLAGTVTLGGVEAVTGGALSPDGKRVALRTYSAIYEWTVTGGDVAKSLTSGKPKKTLLTGQKGQLGEAVAYTPDGTSFLTVPEGTKENPSSTIQKWPIANAVKAAPAAKDGGGSDSDSGGGLLSGISFSQLTTIVAIVGLIGLALLVAGIVGIVRFRQRAQSPSSGGGSRVPPGANRVGNGPGPGFAEIDAMGPADSTMNLPRVTGSVYGASRGGAAVPPAPRGAARPPSPVGAASGPNSPVGWSADRGPEGGFRSEGPVSGAAPVSGPAVGGAAIGGAPVSGAAPVSGPAGRGTVYGGGGGGYDAESTGGRGRRPGAYDPETTGGRGRGPGGPGGPPPGNVPARGYDPETTGGGRVRRPGGPPRNGDPETTGGGRVRPPGDRMRPPPPPADRPVDRSAPTRARRPGPPPPPPGTTYGSSRDPEDSRGGRRDTDGRGWDSRTGGRPPRDDRDPDWESTGGRGGRDPESTGSGRARPPVDRMRPPPPPGERRGYRDDDGNPPPPPGGRRPPPPPAR